jgi:hypothetical protein
MDNTETTAGGTPIAITEKTSVPLPWMASITVTLVLWAVSLTGVYYRLEAQVTAVRVEAVASADVKHHEQDEKIAALEQDQKTIKQATCALARRAQLLVAGCE